MDYPIPAVAYACSGIGHSDFDFHVAKDLFWFDGHGQYEPGFYCHSEFEHVASQVWKREGVNISYGPSLDSVLGSQIAAPETPVTGSVLGRR